jgi:hypothetical protein
MIGKNRDFMVSCFADRHDSDKVKALHPVFAPGED